MILHRFLKATRRRPERPALLPAALLGLALGCAPTGSGAATLTVLTAGAFKPVVLALKDDFESAGGRSLLVDNDTAGALVRRIAGGERFDIVILPPGALDTLAKAGRIAGPMTEVARVGIAVAVAAGAPKPDISTVAALRQTLLDARAVAFIDPASGGSSGAYLVQMFERLGIADAVRKKSVLVPGGLVARRLVSGEADLALHQTSEILAVKGAELVGPLPAEVQNETAYSAAVAVDTSHRAEAQAFIDLLAGPKAAEVRAEKGMLPPRP
ncbi:substrate-binding domain-containing protein [Xanthobacter sp. DSM 24535]|uniref:molybdate ABC transporter substrate-binding protein n=1 Tax=Roseixanthobacter psychrophilus TaxID=3119917 RepID=UPI0037266B1E